jgi:hypothetical protein
VASTPPRHYDFAREFGALYNRAAELYAGGRRGAETYFTPGERDWLAANGITPQNLYDYAEDQAGGGEPGYGDALAIESVRRDYFINVQGGRPSPVVLDEARLPPKTDSIKGIEWLPRIIPKARAKLRGELPASLMYCCGGDRRFFRQHGIFPAEFLSVIWRHDGNDGAVVDWVVGRASA